MHAPTQTLAPPPPFILSTLMLAHDHTGVRCPVEEHKCFQNVPSSDTVILLQDAQTRRETFLESRASIWLVSSSRSEVAFTLINKTCVCVCPWMDVWVDVCWLGWRGGISGNYLSKVACGWMRLILEPQHGLTLESEGAHAFSITAALNKSSSCYRLIWMRWN